MRSNFVAAVALAQLASAAPGLLKRQNLDLGGILNAPSPSAMWPPTGPPMGPPMGPPSTGTSTTSPPTACPTTPEKGTYCGFINPEDACAPLHGLQHLHRARPIRQPHHQRGEHRLGQRLPEPSFHHELQVFPLEIQHRCRLGHQLRPDAG